MPGKPTPSEQPQLDARRAEAARLSLLGWTNLAIGLHLYADPAHNSRHIATPHGYGADRYKDGREPLTDGRLAEAVSKDITRVLEDARTDLETNVTALRTQRVTQYQTLLRAALTEADLDHTPANDEDVDDPRAAAAAAERRYRARDQALRVLARLDTVQGVARPVRQEITGADGAPLLEPVSLSELERLITAAGATPAPAPEAADADQE